MLSDPEIKHQHIKCCHNILLNGVILNMVKNKKIILIGSRVNNNIVNVQLNYLR